MSEPKYCPLLMAAYGSTASTECVKAQCAWYVVCNSDRCGCAVLDIAEGMAEGRRSSL